MRLVVALLALLLIAGCSGAAEPSPSRSTQPSASDPAASTSVNATDPCELLTTAEVGALLGQSADEPTPGFTGHLPNCQWAGADGLFVQAAGVDAAEWARSLPELVEGIAASGQFDDRENLRKLRAAAALIDEGQDLDAGQACELFSTMTELQGFPPGTSSIVTIIPTRTHPQGVAAQTCRRDRFTSVMVANPHGLAAPLPTEVVRKALALAHRRAIEGS